MKRYPSRRVRSGSYPLYRMVMLSILVGAVLSLLRRSSPDSVLAVAGVTGSVVYLVGSLLGSGLILLGLYLRTAWHSLQVERLGAILLATNSGVFLVAVVSAYGIPTATSTWSALAVGLYCVYRAAREIPRELRELRSIAYKKNDEDGGAPWVECGYH